MSAYETLHCIDWQRVMSNLKRAGLHATQVAYRIHACPTGMQRLARGENVRPPPLDTALQLLDLHYDMCPDRHSLEGLVK